MSIKYITLCLFLPWCNLLFAQETEKEATGIVYKNSIYTNIGPFFFGTFQMGYERIFNNIGLLISPRITYKKSGSSSLSTWGVGGEFQYRIYLSGPKTAAYFSPFLTGDYLEDYGRKVTSFGGGALFGLRVAIAKRFLLDMYAGGGLRISAPSYGYIDTDNGLFGPGYSGIMLKAGVQFGINF